MNPSFQQSIKSAVTSLVTIAVAAIQAKPKGKMLSVREKIEKSLLLKEFYFATPPFDPDPSPIIHLGTNTLPKTTIGKCNQADLDYLDLHLNRVYEKDEIVLVGRHVYYSNVVLFLQCFQSLVTN